MSKKYIIIMESVIKFFSIIETINDINFEIPVQNEIFNAGDEVFLYYRYEKKITILLSVKEYADNKLTLCKIFEINNDINFSNEQDISEIIEKAIRSYKSIIEIEDCIYEKIRACIFQNIGVDEKQQKPILENKNSKPAADLFHIQKILYGVPGCGKSHAIEEELKALSISEKNTVRVVFHPEYTNSDFVGQILPKLEDNKVNYVFTPGPFSRILRKAYENKDTNYALVIEEINRGNAAAVFGDIFQLLDRDEAGWSSYCIDNDNINAYIYGAFDKGYEYSEDEQPKQLSGREFSRNTGIQLPPNLSLFATMNTSDQNVFKLDNAFKRRWNFQMISNELDENSSQYTAEIEGFGFSWGTFKNKVNEIITSDINSDGNSFADRQLGSWFVKAEADKDGKYVIPKTVFANKVLEYLWDDVFSLEPEKLFNTSEYPAFSKIIEAVRNGKTDIFNPDTALLV